MEELEINKFLELAISNIYSETEWRPHLNKSYREKMWGKRRDSGEWVETVYVRNKHV